MPWEIDKFPDIIEISLEQIRPNDWNPNVLPKKLYEALKRNIRDKGFVLPILVRKVEDRYEIIDGEHRYKILKELGYSKAKCVVIEAEDDAEAIMRTLAMWRLRGEANTMDVASLLLEQEFETKELEEYLAYSESELKVFQIIYEVPSKIIDPFAKLGIDLPDEKDNLIILEFALDMMQNLIVQQALDKAKEENPEMVKNERLVEICKFYLGLEE